MSDNIFHQIIIKSHRLHFFSNVVNNQMNQDGDQWITLFKQSSIFQRFSFRLREGNQYYFLLYSSKTNLFLFLECEINMSAKFHQCETLSSVRAHCKFLNCSFAKITVTHFLFQGLFWKSGVTAKGEVT